MTTSLPQSLFSTVFQVSSLSGLAMVFFFASDVLVAFRLGTSAAADAFFIASTMPAVLIALCTSVGGALVPVLLPDPSRPADDADGLYATIFNIIVLALLTIAVPGVLFAPTLVAVISPGVNDVTAQLAIVLVRIVSPTVFFSGLAAVLVGMLNAHEQFTYAALSNLVRGAGTLGGMVLFSAYGAVGMSVGWVLGGLIQLIVMLGVCRWRKVFRYRFYIDWRHPSLEDTWTLARTALLGMGAYQATAVLEKVVGSFLPVGMISALSYATRVVRGASQVVVGAITRISLPALAAKSAQNSLGDAYRLFMRNLRFLMYLTFPLTAVLMSLSLPLNTLLLRRGAMTATQVARTASLFSLASIGLIFSGFYQFSLTFLYARRRVGAINMFYAIFLGGFVMWSMLIGWHGEGKGLALTYPLSLLMSAIYGLFVLKIPRTYWATTMIYTIKLTVTALVMGGITFSTATILTPMFDMLSVMARTGFVLSAGLASAGIVWIGMTMMLRVPETVERVRHVWIWAHSRSR